MAEEEGKPFKFIPQGQPEGKSSRDYTGRGQAFYPNEDIFDGDYRGGKRNGKGIYIYNKPENPADKYDGDFKDNKKHGIGLMTYVVKNETYYGQWENGKKHGEGIYTYANKDIYSGWFAFGKKQGKGTYVFAKTGQRIEGIWEDNKVVEGKWILPNGTFYEGKFSNNKPNGQGRWYFKNGNVVDGEYKQKKIDPEDDTQKPTFILSWQAGSKFYSSASCINAHLNF